MTPADHKIAVIPAKATCKHTFSAYIQCIETFLRRGLCFLFGGSVVVLNEFQSIAYMMRLLPTTASKPPFSARAIDTYHRIACLPNSGSLAVEKVRQ